jgi:peroxiredoxin
MKRLTVLLTCLVLFAGLGFAQTKDEPAKTEYDDAPDFTLTDVEGDEYTLSDLLEDGPVYMVSWDLPCVNCIAELDALMPVYDTLKERDLQIISLSVDKPSDEAQVKAFVASKGWPYYNLLDPQHEVKQAYNIVVGPTAYLINTDQKIVYRKIGFKSTDLPDIRAELLKWVTPEESDSGKVEGAPAPEKKDE